MRIGILGWGSLLWEGGAEFDECHEPWRFEGPSLRIEFSRISSTRLGALTLVIDAEHGAPTTVAWCLSKRANVDAAVQDLRARKNTTPQNIGHALVDRATPAAATTREDPLAAWACAHKLDAVVWAALASNFQERTGQAFSVHTALAYLNALAPEAKARAAEYVRRAPGFVMTPLRIALQTEPWFSQPGNGIT